VLATELRAFLAEEELADRRGFLSSMPDVTLAGVELGAYRLERPLGQGGMGSVWLARRTDGRFEGVAALKLLNLAMVNPTVQERFRREGSVLARLSHPGIARLLDAGISPTGQPYLIIEHVNGLPIDEYADRHRLTRNERIELFLKVLDAVGHAHTNLIVHRDLKPSNILVTEDGAVKLLDFGIAKLLDDDASGERTALTLEGGRVFTPHYAAPEQVRGDTLTTATDVYALGVLLYVLLSGHHPTAEKSRTPAETVQALLEREPAKLGLRDLDTVLAKALRKQADQRYQTVATFADDLQRYLRKEPVSARPNSIGYRIGKFVRRNTAATLASLALLAVLVAATLYSLAQTRRATQERDLALRESQRADAMLGFQRSLFAMAGDHPMTLDQLMDEGMTLLSQRHTGDPLLETHVTTGFAGMYLDLGHRDRAIKLFVRAESLAAETGDRAFLAGILCRTARVMTDMDMTDSAPARLVLWHQIPPASLDVEDLAMCLDAEARYLVEQENGDSAVALDLEALDILEKNRRTRSRSYFSIASQLGIAYETAGDWRKSIAWMRRAVAAADSIALMESVGGLNGLHQMVFGLLVLGEITDADSITHRIMQLLDQQNLAVERAAVYVTNRAAVTQLMDWPDSAYKYFSRLDSIAPVSHGLSLKRRALYGMGRSEAQQGRLAEARQTLARLETMRDSTGSPSREELLLLGWLRTAEGNLAAADTAFARVLTRDGYSEGKTDNPSSRQVLLAAADIALRLGDPARALRMAEDARTMATVDSLTETRSGYVGEARLLETRALLAQGDTTRARVTLWQALIALKNGYGEKHSRTREAETLREELGAKAVRR
jgi:tetratricopeptide (TPR) repeat protein